MRDESGGDVLVDGVEVRGVDLDAETRCAHYASDRDVLAIEFACCRTFYSCHECHDALADHESEVWPPAEFGEPALLCGVCGGRITIEAYLGSPLSCPSCGTAFNPGCRDHHDRYFDA